MGSRLGREMVLLLLLPEAKAAQSRMEVMMFLREYSSHMRAESTLKTIPARVESFS